MNGGLLQFIVLIFSVETMNPLWSMNVDIFAEWDSADEFNNARPGKHHPGMSRCSSVGKHIPVLR